MKPTLVLAATFLTIAQPAFAMLNADLDETKDQLSWIVPLIHGGAVLLELE